MEHFVSFIIVIAIVLSAISVAISIWFRNIYRNRASLWFAATIAGLGAFLIEILIWRYAVMVRPLISDLLYKSMISFSNIWALIGGLLVSISMPVFAMIQTGSSPKLIWNLFRWIPPLLTFVFGVMFLLKIFYSLSLIALQGVIFLTVGISILSIIILSRGEIGKKNRTYIRHIIILSVIFFPFIILDATGFPLPGVPEDIILTLYVIGICLVSLFEVKKLFGEPTYLNENKISSFFIESYRISPRERDVVELVLEGESNQRIGKKLFISEKTVENHLTSIFKKTEVKSRMELFRMIYSSRD